jgi:polar amino acid transport system substrate-binding protein
MRALTAGLLLAALLAGPAPAADAPLRAGVVPDTPPFVQTDAAGQLTGFSVALFRAIAAEMKRGITFTAAPLPQLMEDLDAGRLDVLPGPIPATPERASDLLFIEGYIWTEYQFGSRPGDTIAGLDNLRGKRLAVEADSEYAGWAERQAARLGFTMVPEPTLAAVFAAVRHGQADASLSGSPALRAAAASGGLQAGLSLPETRTHDSAAVAATGVELRDEIEDALRCLKQSGAVAQLSQQWLHSDPGPEDLENMVIPGYGVPDLAGFDPKPRKSHCQR